MWSFHLTTMIIFLCVSLFVFSVGVWLCNNKMYIFLKATTFLLILHFSSTGFCASLPFPANNWPSAVWLWFRQHGKHWQCMKSYDVQIVLKTITALSEPCGAAQCHAAVAWLKRPSNCGHTQCWYDSRGVLKVQHCLSSNACVIKWERSDGEGGSLFRFTVCCQERATITATLL